MIEQFYAIGHLTTEQLRELFSSNRNRGWVDYEYYKLMPEGGYSAGTHGRGNTI